MIENLKDLYNGCFMEQKMLKLLSSPFYWVLLVTVVLVSLFKGLTIGVDIPIYHTAAKTLSNSYFDIYTSSRGVGGGHYTAGPLAAILWLPGAYLSEIVMRSVWAFLNVFFFLGLWLLCKRVYAKAFPKLPLSVAAQSLTLIMLVDPISMNGIQANWTSVLLLSCLGGFYLLQNQRSFLAGFLSSFAFCIKPPYGFPVLLFLLLKDRKAVMGWVLGVVCFGVFLPFLALGKMGAFAVYQDWFHTLSSVAADPYCKYNNQSALCVAYHLFGRQSPFVIWFVLGFAAISGGFLVWILRRFRRSDKFLGLVFVAGFFIHLTWSNLVHDHYYMAMLLPLLWINNLLVNRKLSKLGVNLWWLRFVIVHLFVMAIVGREWSIMALNFGQHLWGVLLCILMGFDFLQGSLADSTQSDLLSARYVEA